ncbi:MAG: MAPEG family protein [Alphaproteobacteria bacterium]|nr:MAPEG family protein [Rhodospirillaceae bacterium]MBT6202848.1 MAPEG family protein [Rhodospirillaceae bacterium]MBT6509990.1 MAPEG family protein [Rhodospirillaceae bacterium]MBT7648840.1 MAPEG family protein [Rhodospirillaceae bacterium]MDG2479310.1 MAPEG family protein [Alphaproteobacteria bacterium]
MALSDKQKGVMRGMATAAAFVVITLAIAILWRPTALLPATDAPGARLGWAAAWLLGPALCLLLSIGRLAGQRFHTPEDIDGSGLTTGSERAHVLQAIIQNTLEQTLLAALVWGACAMLLPFGWLAAIPAATLLFVVGRILFAWGYVRGAPGRALGFALTFYGTAALALIAVIAAAGQLLDL